MKQSREAEDNTIETDFKKFDSIFDPNNKWVIQNESQQNILMKVIEKSNISIQDFSAIITNKIKENSHLFPQLNKNNNKFNQSKNSQSTDQAQQSIQQNKALNEFYESLSSHFQQMGLRIDSVKILELINFIYSQEQKLHLKKLLGKKKLLKTIDQSSSQDAIQGQVIKWLNKHQEYLIPTSRKLKLSRNNNIVNGRIQNQRYQKTQNPYASEDNAYGVQDLNSKSVMITNSVSPYKNNNNVSNYLMTKKDISTVKSYNESNLKGMSKLIDKFTIAEQQRQKQEFQQGYSNFKSPQKNQTKQQKLNQSMDLANKTFYTQHEDDSPGIRPQQQDQSSNFKKFTTIMNKTKFLKLPTIGRDSKVDEQKINPYEDQQTESQFNKRHRSIDPSSQISYQNQQKHHRLVSSDVLHSLDYNMLRKDISHLFDVMQLDKQNFKQFKQFMHEEAFRNEQRYQSEFYQRNERLKEYKRERALKEKQQLEKDLEQMIVNLPRASQACRMEQLMTTKFLNEMPTQYRIISHFDGNDIAKRRLNQLLKKL